MPAKSMRQDREIQDVFRQRMREKVARDKAEMKDRIDEAVPPWLACRDDVR